ncbi:universal stress protein [Jatrophihabitans fulvus]
MNDTTTTAGTGTGPADSTGPRIVVGVDGSAESQRALRWAGEAAARGGGVITVIGVWEFPTTYGWSALPPLYEPHPEVEKSVVAAVDAVFGEHRPADLAIRVLQGPTAQRLLDAAKKANLLVVGRRGSGGFTGLHIGSVSRAVSAHATCPVVVVP